jgi:hypothetical protein
MRGGWGWAFQAERNPMIDPDLEDPRRPVGPDARISQCTAAYMIWLPSPPIDPFPRQCGLVEQQESDRTAPKLRAGRTRSRRLRFRHGTPPGTCSTASRDSAGTRPTAASAQLSSKQRSDLLNRLSTKPAAGQQSDADAAIRIAKRYNGACRRPACYCPPIVCFFAAIWTKRSRWLETLVCMRGPNFPV